LINLNNNIYFDEAKESLAVSINVAYSNSAIESILKQSLLFFTFIILLLVFIYYMLSRFLNKHIANPITSLSDLLKKGDLNLLTSINKNNKKPYLIYESAILAAGIEDLAKKIIEFQIKLVEQSKLAAIGQTTSMLAHDVRKPFTQIKMILSSFEIFKKNPSKLEDAKKDVDKAIKNVETMVSDIMDFSREVKLATTPTSLEPLLDFTIRQVLQSYSGLNINFQYNLSSDYRPLLDEERMARVFVNIIGNAIEAISVIGGQKEGTVWFNSAIVKKEGINYLQLIIGNSGPLILEKALPKLFDSFYTSGKNKGTGLGLASAQKIVKLHEGKIQVQNNIEKNGVEFIIDLPASDKRDQIQSTNLPQSSKDIFTPERSVEIEIDQLVQKVIKANTTYKIILLEDEVL